MRLSFNPLLLLVLSVILISSSFAAIEKEDCDDGQTHLLHREDNKVVPPPAPKVSLKKLGEVHHVDERKPVIPKNEVALAVVKTSTTPVKPKSDSGARVIAEKTGNVVKVAKQSNTTKTGDVILSNKMQISNSASPVCPAIDHRKPWSKATSEERFRWLKAIRCTYDIAGTFKHGKIKSKSLAQDFGLVHNYLKIAIHNDPSFFPCHRIFLLNWLKRLREECGYEGNSLYLDVNTYTDDGSFFDNDDLWSYDNLGSLEIPVNGNFMQELTFEFIGSRRNDSTEILETWQTLNRGRFDKSDSGNDIQLYMQTQIIEQALALTDYDEFRTSVEHKIHDAFHQAIRRTMFPGTSPYDAFIFFPFHSFIDCLWLKWQEKSKKNLLAYDGLHRGTDKPVSINDGCAMLGLGTDYTVADLLDPSESPGCFDCPDFKPSS